jgi:acetyl/propionyl-CoA carboxylase alpha subunit
MTSRPATTVLVANRGEIAVRVFRTARRLGLRCVAVYSEADADALFVRMADSAICIGPAPAKESYLRADRILEAARLSRADLVHPGFGFLSEDASFGRAVHEAGFLFVGPPPEVLAAMGGKDEAKRIAQAAGVPVLPGYGGEDQSDEALRRAADDIGYPVIVKPAAGGGGKGMAVVRSPEELEAALASARRVATGAFGDARLLLERYLAAPRHVEVQIIADAHGTVLHLGERDCSLQRRHQKILEETPSPVVDATLRERLCGSAVALARHVGYRNAGTCEFLLDDAGVRGVPGDEAVFGFIEMNARLQVEHPVTEAVTGLDLVELQLRVAMGEPLSLTQDEVGRDGHAVEVRLYAEDPDAGFLPQAGRLVHLRWPAGTRIDSGVEEGSEVTTFYDPMLAKLIVHAPDRPAALAALTDALAETEVLGVRTNLPFLRAVVADPVVSKGDVTTTWLQSAYQGWTSGTDEDEPPEAALALAAAAETARILSRARSGDGSSDPWSAAGPWRLLGPGPVRLLLQPGGHPRTPGPADHGERLFEVEGSGPFRVGDHTAELILADGHAWTLDGEPAAAASAPDGASWHVWWQGAPYQFTVGPRTRLVDAEGGAAHLGAPMPGTVIAVKVAPGETVSRGQELVVVEAMKMELAVKATADGVVTAVLCAPGDQVKRDQPLVDFEPAGDAAP